MELNNLIAAIGLGVLLLACIALAYWLREDLKFSRQDSLYNEAWYQWFNQGPKRDPNKEPKRKDFT